MTEHLCNSLGYSKQAYYKSLRADRGGEERERYVLSNCKIIEYIKVLEYHSHLLAMLINVCLWICDIGSLKENMASGGLLQTV